MRRRIRGVVWHGLRAGACVALIVIAFARLASPSRAQESQLDTFASQGGLALKSAQLHDVVVLDFTGTPEMSALGEHLAADYRTALARYAAPSNLKIEDSAATLDRATEMSVTLANLRDPATLRWVYAGTPVDSYVSGTLTESDAGLKLTLDFHRLADDKKVAELSSTIPFPPDLRSLLVTPEPDEFASMPINGATGYTAAKCIACPHADYALEAVRAHAQGTVILSFTIDKHGRTKDVRVKQAMPDGLTQQAVNTVLAWTFTPAKDPRGKRIDVRQTTEVEFHQ
jgi:TonB family protein